MATIIQEDHVEIGFERLIDFWQDKPVVKGLLEAYTRECNKLEELFFQLLNERGIYVAVGQQLDVIGALFGEERDGKGDDEYRAAILGRVTRLNADGTTENFMNAMRIVGGTNLVDFWEHPNADIHAYMGEGVGLGTFSDVKDSSPAGVSMRIIFDDAGDSFVPSELIPSAYDLQTNNEEDLQTNNNEDMQVTVTSLGVFARAYLPEIEETPTVNPLADLINRDSRRLSGDIVLENQDFLIDNLSGHIAYESYEFTQGEINGQ